ncbi:MAG: peptidoglycan DD-metalloendopeptidase family protein [Oscillospiraceae bacterium]|jgi:murein DD-endopeptidase MepM/ murein hydrolase activator NlpD|nr:peptidoglycan DD-metalloendopeptidase family protein [Oscillospiraceae bacterium]
MYKNRIFKEFFSVICLITFFQTPQFTAFCKNENASGKLGIKEELQKQNEDLKAILFDNERKIKSERENFLQLNSDAESTSKKILEIEQEILKLEEQKVFSEAKIKELESEKNNVLKEVKGSLISINNGEEDCYILRFLFASKDIDDFFNRFNVVRFLSNRNSECIHRAQEVVSQLESKKISLKQEEEFMEKTKEQAISQKKHLDLLKCKSEDSMQAFSKESQCSKDNIIKNEEELKKIDNEIQECLKKLQEEEILLQKKEEAQSRSIDDEVHKSQNVSSNESTTQNLPKKEEKPAPTSEAPKTIVQNPPANKPPVHTQANHQDDGHYCWPVAGKHWDISCGYGNDVLNGVPRFHRGLDIINSASITPIISAGDGVVAKVFNGCGHDFAKNGSCGCGGGYGNFVVIRLKNGNSVIYAHLSKVFVKEGDHVKFKQAVGEMGSTGWSTGKHVHFEVRNRDGVSFDPTSISYVYM